MYKKIAKIIYFDPGVEFCNIITITSASKTKSNFAFKIKLISRVIIKCP